MKCDPILPNLFQNPRTHLRTGLSRSIPAKASLEIQPSVTVNNDIHERTTCAIKDHERIATGIATLKGLYKAHFRDYTKHMQST